MTIPAYPKYRPSGIEWLGKVPTHWIVRQARYMFTLQRGHDLPSEKMVPGKYPVQGSNGVVGYHNQCTTAAPGVTVGRSGSVGKVNYIDRPFWAHNTALFVKDFRGLPPRFIFYLLKALDTERLAAGSAVGTLDRNKIHSQYVASPTAAEAAGICSFLDHETAKIDALIREQERLIDLLQEKCQAVISHAVTKGLNPDVIMKDSGVEWLGEVPAHWDVTRMRFVCRITTGDKDTQDAKEDGQYPFFVRSDTIEKSDTFSFDGEGVFTSGDGAGVGKIFHYFSGKCAIHQRVYLFHSFYKTTGKFFYHYLRSKLEHVVLSQSAKSTVDSLRLPMLQNFWMTRPPHEEQQLICDYINSFERQSLRLLADCSSSIQLLKERRSALISAAVTGKIDVRNWQPPVDESAFDEDVRQAGMEVTA